MKIACENNSQLFQNFLAQKGKIYVNGIVCVAFCHNTPIRIQQKQE